MRLDHHRMLKARGVAVVLLTWCVVVEIAGCTRESDLAAYRLAVAMQQGMNPDIVVMDGEGRIVDHVTDTPQKSEMWPMWDPLGQALYYESRDRRNGTVSLTRRRLGSPTEDTLYTRAEKGALWFTLSADGTKLAYMAKDSSQTHLDVLDLPRGSIKTLDRDGERLIRPEWAPDSRQLLAQVSASDDDLWDLVVVDTETGERRTPLSSTDRSRFKARWALDSRSIVYCVTHDEQRRRVGLHIARVGESPQKETVLADENDERVISGVWSPNGTVAALRERPLPLTVFIWQNPWESREATTAELDAELTRGRLVWSHDGEYIAANVANRRRGQREGWNIIILDRNGRIVKTWDHDLNVICPAWAPRRAPLETMKETRHAAS